MEQLWRDRAVPAMAIRLGASLADARQSLKCFRMKHPLHFLSALLLTALTSAAPVCAEEPTSVDVCIYGATPAGIVAAVAARQEGCTVVLIEPSRWVGGILGAGIKPMQDCAEPKAV